MHQGTGLMRAVSTPTIAGVVVARNAEALIADCLASLRGLDALIVIDNQSTDATAQVARDRGARVVPCDLDDMGLLRAFARRQVAAPWMVMLDADERLPADGLARVRAAIDAAPADLAAFALPIRTLLGDRWLRWGGYYPAARPRVFRVAAVDWPAARVHERPTLAGRLAPLDVPLRHHSYRDLAHARAKTRRYAALAAVDDARSGLRRGPVAAGFRALWRVARVFLLRHGWRMGRLGWRLAWMQARGVWWRYRGPPAPP